MKESEGGEKSIMGGGVRGMGLIEKNMFIDFTSIFLDLQQHDLQLLALLRKGY